MTNCEQERYNALGVKKDERVRKFLDSNSESKRNFGFATTHNPKSVDIFKFIETLDFVLGDKFWFRSGGDGDNGEILMSELDAYFEVNNE